MSVTIHDIAVAAGLNASTVSRALNHDPRIKPATQARIQALAERLGYVMNRSARNLALGSTGMICLAVNYIFNDQFAVAAEALNRFLAARGYTLMILIYNNNLMQYKRILNDFSQKLCDGAILYCPPGDSAKMIEFQRLRKSGFPMVCLDQWLENVPIPAVSNNAAESIATLTEPLLENGMDAACVLFHEANTVSRFRKRETERILRGKNIPFASNMDQVSALLRKRPRHLGVYGDSPACIGNIEPWLTELHSGTCLGAMFDAWKFKAPSRFSKIFLCIQDTVAESEYAADLVLKLLKGEPVPQTFPALFSPLKIISPVE